MVEATSPTLVTPTLGTPNSVILTNATGLPLSTGVTGNLPVGNLNSGTSASSSTFWRGDGTWSTPSGGGSSEVNGYINGFTLSNDGTSPNTVVDIAAGYASDSSNAVMITGTAFTKTTGGAWSSGSGNSGMGSGLTITANTWYHVFAIINAGSFDVYFDTSATAANAPASTTAHRYIGDIRTASGTTVIRTFSQNGNQIVWGSPMQDGNNAVGTTETTLTLSTPPGFITYPTFYGYYQNTTAQSEAQLFPGTSTSSMLLIFNTVTTPVIGDGIGYSYFSNPQGLYTNTSSQISYTTGTNSVSTSALNIFTTGYINPHLAPNF